MNDYDLGYHKCEQRYVNFREGIGIGILALKSIQKHMQIVIPKGYKLSGVWQIANNALKDLEKLS